MDERKKKGGFRDDALMRRVREGKRVVVLCTNGSLDLTRTQRCREEWYLTDVSGFRVFSVPRERPHRAAVADFEVAVPLPLFLRLPLPSCYERSRSSGCRSRRSPLQLGPPNEIVNRGISKFLDSPRFPRSLLKKKKKKPVAWLVIRKRRQMHARCNIFL